MGVVSISEAQALADQQGLDLVEISPNANPPVCKVIDYGKFRYNQTKKDKESRKSQAPAKVKEVKLRPNINEHDLEVKLRRAQDFLGKGFKVKFTLMFRGREMAHPERGHELLAKIREAIEADAVVELNPKMMGRFLTMVVAPSGKKKATSSKESKSAKNENAQSANSSV